MTYLPPLGPPRPVHNDPDELYEKLSLAGMDTPPASEDDDTFIADRTDLIPADLTRMRYVCNRCSLFDPCRDYADAEQPRAGFWAGSHRGKP